MLPCLQRAGVGHGTPATQTPWPGYILTFTHPRHAHQPGQGAHAPLTLLHRKLGHLHPPSGCQARHGGGPQRQEVIQRTKPLRKRLVLFTALRQLQRKAFIADRRILFQRDSPGPLQQNNRALVSIYLSCLAHMYFKYI